MAVIEQTEFDVDGSAEERLRRERADRLRQGGIRPAKNPSVLARTDRKTVKPYSKWLLRLARLIP